MQQWSQSLFRIQPSMIDRVRSRLQQGTVPKYAGNQRCIYIMENTTPRPPNRPISFGRKNVTRGKRKKRTCERKRRKDTG
jgi:hypothetical protein